MSVRTRCDECDSEYMARISTASRQMELIGHHQCRKHSSRRAGLKTGEKMRDVYREKMRGDGNIARQPGVGAKISAAQTGKTFSEARRRGLRVPKSKTDLIKAAANRPEEVERRRERIIKRIQAGFPYGPCNFGPHRTDQTPRSIFCRSGLEKHFLDYAAFSSAIETIETAEDIRISYIGSDERRHDYLPDFKLTMKDGKIVIVEMKGSFFQRGAGEDKCRRKAEALQVFCDHRNYGCVTLNEREYRSWLRQLGPSDG